MKLPRQRRIEGKTDYKSRLGLLKSGKPRLVVRKTNRYIIVQIVESNIAQDRVVTASTSKDLLSKGWPEEKAGSLKSLSACYLTGFLVAESALKKGLKEAIFDIGMNRNVQKSRIYAVLKGAVDAGLKIPHNDETFPSEEQLNIKEFSALIKKIAK